MPFFTRHLPDTVEATQWFPGQCISGITNEQPGHPGGGGLLPAPPHAHLTTRKGQLTVFAGDWVVTEPTGDKSICQDYQFKRSYVPVDAAPGHMPQ